jgi:hypothetical protein
VVPPFAARLLNGPVREAPGLFPADDMRPFVNLAIVAVVALIAWLLAVHFRDSPALRSLRLTTTIAGDVSV